jgi:hypothetical protein
MADIYAPRRTGVGLRPTNVVTLREVLGPATRDGFAPGAFAARYALIVRPIRRAAQAMSSHNIPVGRGLQRGPAGCAGISHAGPFSRQHLPPDSNRWIGVADSGRYRLGRVPHQAGVRPGSVVRLARPSVDPQLRRDDGRALPARAHLQRTSTLARITSELWGVFKPVVRFVGRRTQIEFLTSHNDQHPSRAGTALLGRSREPHHERRADVRRRRGHASRSQRNMTWLKGRVRAWSPA